MFTWSWILVASILSGCRGAAEDDLDPLDNADTDAGTDSAVEPQETDAPPSEQPEFWSLDGVLVITAGQVDPDQTQLIVDLWRDGKSVCAATMPADTDAGTDSGAPPVTTTGTTPTITAAAAVDAADVPADVPVLGWWTLAISESEAPCAWPLPATAVEIGIGAFDTRLYPALEARGDEDPAATSALLYGAYLRPGPDAPVWVFGVAGTDEQYAGTAATVAAPPLPDGAYIVQSLFLLPLTTP